MLKQSKIYQFVFTTAFFVGSLLMSGCHLQPNFGPQGTIGNQRNRAVLHDPFPSKDMGPDIMSGRPLGFDQPWSEARSIQSTPFARRGSRVIRPNGF